MKKQNERPDAVKGKGVSRVLLFTAIFFGLITLLECVAGVNRLLCRADSKLPTASNSIMLVTLWAGSSHIFSAEIASAFKGAVSLFPPILTAVFFALFYRRKKAGGESGGNS